MLLGAVSQLLQALEVDHCRLHIVLLLLLLLLLLKLHSHKILHLHEVVGDHAELLILWIISTSLRIEHHLHVHVGVDIIHTLPWEAHLILHHHTRELIHVLHAVHANRCGHLVLHALILVHLGTSWCAIIGSQLVFSVRVRALVHVFAIAALSKMSAQNSFEIGSRHAVRSLLLYKVRFLILLLDLIVPILRLIVVVLIHSVHVILHVVLVVAASVAAHVLAATAAAAEASEVALILHAAPAILWRTASRPYWSLFPHLLVFTRRLIAVLVLDALLRQ